MNQKSQQTIEIVAIWKILAHKSVVPNQSIAVYW